MRARVFVHGEASYMELSVLAPLGRRLHKQRRTRSWATSPDGRWTYTEVPGAESVGSACRKVCENLPWRIVLESGKYPCMLASLEMYCEGAKALVVEFRALRGPICRAEDRDRS